MDSAQRKVKVAVWLGYNGKNYCGMQINPRIETVEKVLFAAFCQAGLVSALNSQDIKKIGWQRASRTDKGVHAALQLVSCKLLLGNDLEKPKEEVKKYLPSDLAVFSFQRTVKSFDSKNECTHRTYEYLCPSILFQKKDFAEFSSSKKGDLLGTNQAFCLSEEDCGFLKRLLARYVGTKNFHNFTNNSRTFRDPSSQRYILDACIARKLLVGESEWVVLHIKGQSFMLHQIRKMVGLCVLVASFARARASEIFDMSFRSEKMNIPKVPASGLLLLEPFFSGYNKKISGREDLLQLDSERIREEASIFRAKMIYPDIISPATAAEHVAWLMELREYSKEFQYLSEESSNS